MTESKGTREIPRERWNHYLDELTERMEHHLVTVEEEGELGSQLIAEKVPLIGIEPEEKGSQACGIDVMVGKQALTEDRLTHSVRCPTRLLVKENEQGGVEVLDIEGETPVEHTPIKTIIRFF